MFEHHRALLRQCSTTDDGDGNALGGRAPLLDASLEPKLTRRRLIAAGG